MLAIREEIDVTLVPALSPYADKVNIETRKVTLASVKKRCFLTDRGIIRFPLRRAANCDVGLVFGRKVQVDSCGHPLTSLQFVVFNDWGGYTGAKPATVRLATDKRKDVLLI